jgi:hypothetical protein
VNRNRLQLSLSRITRCGLLYCFLCRESVRCSDVYGPESLLVQRYIDFLVVRMRLSVSA